MAKISDKKLSAPVDVQIEMIMFADDKEFSATFVLDCMKLALSKEPLPAIIVTRSVKGHYNIRANIKSFLAALALGHKTVKVQIYE